MFKQYFTYTGYVYTVSQHVHATNVILDPRCTLLWLQKYLQYKVKYIIKNTRDMVRDVKIVFS